MNDTERKAEDHFRRSEWLKALECFEQLLAANQNNKNGNCIFPKEKLVTFLIGKSECNLALGRTDTVAQDCRKALKLFVDGSNEFNGCHKDRARRLLLKSLVYGKRYAEAESAVKEWLVKGKVQSDTRKILEQVKNRFENQGQRGQNISAQKLEEDLMALEATLNGVTRNSMAALERNHMANEPGGRKGPKGDDFSCSYCSIRFPDAAALRAHCQTGSHQTIIMSDEGRDWKYRPPPRGLTADAYALCEGYEEKHGSCRYGEKCVDAHGTEELAEWRERFEYRRMKMQRASEKQLYGKSYTEMILDKWINAPSPDHVMRDRIDGVEEAISGDLVTSVSSKNSQREWTFLLKTPLKLKAVALLQDAHRNHFSLRQVSSGDAATLMSGAAWKPSNDQEWTNGPITAEVEHSWTNGDLTSGPVLEHRVRVGFKTEIYGTFRQSVVFDFGTEPVLVKHLCVDVVPVTDVDKMKEIRKEVVVSSAERWCADNAEVVPFTSVTVPPTGTSILDGEKEHRLLESYPTPRADSFTLTQSTVVEKSVTKNNYRDRMHELLYVEEMARYEQVARYNVGTKLQVANCYLLAPNGMANSTAKYAHHGELFALMSLGKDVSEDTSAGRLILNNCSTVFISANHNKDTREGVKRVVYEALIEDKGKNMIYLRLSAVTVAALGLRPDLEFPCQVQFQLNRIPYCEWHFAIDKIADYKLIFPDTVLEPSIPWSPQRQWNDVIDSRLNSKQREAVVAITSPAQMPLPPILIIGPFGTGKTYTLAQAIKQLMTQPEARILVCTHSNSAADLYIKDYLHPWVEAGHEEARPLRIYYHKRWVATVNQVVQKYCLIEMASGARTFKIPSLEDIMKHRIVVVTLSISMYLSTMGLKKGHFTHILLDEAAQAMECEAIMPLALANERTRIVLAGDHMQLSPELFSQFAKDRNLHVSLLERLYDHYPGTFPCKILLCENYRAHEAIINFTSELFYDQKLVSSGKQPRHDKFYPLTFFTTRGEDVQDINSTAFYNCSEVYEVVERVCELRKKWPPAWGKLEDQSIGIMTPYADQVFRIRSELRKRRMGSISVERVLNVQGKQFRAIFLSTVRTRRTCLGSALKPANELDFGFLSNWKLLNTAITRAQSLVAVVGDPVALCSIGRCRKVWERFIEICNDNKSLYGITWSLLRSQLDGVELKKTYTLNPLAPEFVPRAMQNESYIKLPSVVPGFGPGVMPSFMATPLNYPLFYYPPPSQAPPLFPLRPPSVPIPYHIGAPNPWPPFNPLSPTGKKEESKTIIAVNLPEPKSPVLMDMSSLLPNLDGLDIPPQGIILENFLRPAPLQLHAGVIPERHVTAHMPMSLGAPVLRSSGDKSEHIQFLNNVHFPERVPSRPSHPAHTSPASIHPPADWPLLLPPNTTLAEVLDSRELQMNWYRYLATSVSLDIADKFKDLIIHASEKPVSPTPELQVPLNLLERTAELNLGPKPLLLRDLEAAMLSQAQLQSVPSQPPPPPQLQQQQQQPMGMPPPNVPPPTLHQLSVPPPSIPLYRRQAPKEDPFLTTFQQQGLFMQPPPSVQPYLNDFHLNGREQDIEEPASNRHNVETTYASVLRAQSNRTANSDEAHSPFGVLKSLARSSNSHGGSGLYHYFE